MKTLLLALMVSSLLLFGCAGYSSPPAANAPGAPPPAANNPPTPPAAPPAANASPPVPPATASIDISGFAFSPAELTVAKGTTVTWTNNDGVPHTVTSSSGAFDSGDMPSGASWSFTFGTPGTFDYRCGIHASMKGRITVTG